MRTDGAGAPELLRAAGAVAGVLEVDARALGSDARWAGWARREGESLRQFGHQQAQDGAKLTALRRPFGAVQEWAVTAQGHLAWVTGISAPLMAAASCAAPLECHE
jgi:hypothetical protein